MKHKIYLILSLFVSASYLFASVPDFDWMKDVGARKTPSATDRKYFVSDYGAMGNALFLCTEAIQKTIDDCAANGGGVVTFKPGIYLTGSIFLKSNVILDIPKGTMLIGSQDLKDYPLIDTRVAGMETQWPAALINILGQDNAAITGDGVVHGRGKPFWDKYHEMRQEYDPKGLRWIIDYDCQRPRGILVANSIDITIKDIVFYQSGFWAVHILYSEHVTIDGMIIDNDIEGRGPSTDGIDIDSSSKILVQNCNINCNDDNFCLKAGRDADGLRVNRPCEYIVIRDCIAGLGDGLFTCGSETSGSIRNIVAYNLKGLGTKYGLRFKSSYNRGGTIENIYLYNIEMINVRDPFVVDLNWLPAYNARVLPEGYNQENIPQHWKTMLQPVNPALAMPKFKNVFLEDIKASGSRIGIVVEGMKGDGTVDNFTLKNVSIEAADAGKINYAKDWKFENVKITGTEKNTIEITNSKNVKYK